MKANHIVIMAGLMLVAYSFIAPHLGGSVVTPEPVNPGGPDFYTVFSSQTSDQKNAAIAAREFGHLCDSIAHGIEFDGEQAEPQLTNGMKLHDFSAMCRFTQVDGKSYSSTYPKLPGVIAEYMDAKVGKDGGKIDDAQRAKWVKAFRAMAASAKYAADRMEWEG